MDDIKKYMHEIMQKAIKNHSDNVKRNKDTTSLNKDSINEMLSVIAVCESQLDVLTTLCDRLGGFGSFYPISCLDHLNTQRAILEMELRRFESET